MWDPWGVKPERQTDPHTHPTACDTQTKKGFAKEMEYTEFGSCYDLKQAHIHFSSLDLPFWHAFYSLLDETVLLLTGIQGLNSEAKHCSGSQVASEATRSEFSGSDRSNSTKSSPSF